MIQVRRLLPLAAMLAIACSPKAAPIAEPHSRGAAFQAENDRAMATMMAGMHVAATGDVDRDFALMMIPHHQGAVDMARALLKYGRNERLRALARSIVATQTREIAIMREAIGPAGDPPPAAPMAGHVHHGM